MNCNYTLRQFRYIENTDYLPPPPAYFILGADLEWKPEINGRQIFISLNGSNILNHNYRDYLNRMRYYYGEPGVNIYLKLRIPFETLIN